MSYVVSVLNDYVYTTPTSLIQTSLPLIYTYAQDKLVNVTGASDGQLLYSYAKDRFAQDDARSNAQKKQAVYIHIFIYVYI